MRSVWKGSISFGLVYIPVAVYPSTKEEKVSFKQLRKSDLSPIRYKKVAEADEKEVPAEEIVKGYEYEKGKWVVLEDKDFEQVQLLAVLQESIRENADKRKKGIAGARPSKPRSTGALVKQKRKTGALGMS
jgi:Ku protein